MQVICSVCRGEGDSQNNPTNIQRGRGEEENEEEEHREEDGQSPSIPDCAPFFLKCHPMQWNEMECSVVECNGMQQNGVECSGMKKEWHFTKPQGVE